MSVVLLFWSYFWVFYVILMASPSSSSSSESATPLLDGCTSSTFSVRDDISTPSSAEVFVPRSNRLRPTWRSPVWEFYCLSEDTKYAICKTCNMLVSRGGGTTKSYNTTNLVAHLKANHADEYAKFTELKTKKDSERETARKDRTRSGGIGGLRQLTLHGSKERVQQWDINDTRAVSIHKKLGEMIALDCQPVSIVEDIGFNCFVKATEPRYTIPSRKYFSETVIPRIHEGVKAELMKKVHSPGVTTYSFTCDIWSTSTAGESLLSLTAHWVVENFERTSAVLHVMALEGSHTGMYIAEKFNNMLSDWSINKENVHLVLRDNASNMERAMKDANVDSFGCFAHSLQLVVHDGVLSQRVVSDLLAVCRRIVGHFKRSTKATDKLKDIQQSLGIPNHRLKQDEVTRWNSSLEMLKSIVEQKMALAAYGSDGAIPVLSAYQLDIANKVINVLTPVEEITKNISSDTAPISVIIPLVRALHKTLQQHDGDIGIRGMKSGMLTSLTRRFVEIEETDYLTLATLLDPRFKDKSFSNAAFRENAIHLLKSQYTSEVEDCQLEEPPSKRIATGSELMGSSSVWGCLTEILTESTGEVAEEREYEVDQYLASPLLDLKSSPFKWWESYHYRYPVLARLVKKYLSAPPTSVNSERVFSGAGELYSDRRSRLLPQLAEKLLLIKYNFPMVGKIYKY